MFKAVFGDAPPFICLDSPPVESVPDFVRMPTSPSDLLDSDLAYDFDVTDNESSKAAEAVGPRIDESLSMFELLRRAMLPWRRTEGMTYDQVMQASRGP